MQPILRRVVPAAIALLALAASPAHAALADLTGQWTNSNPASRSLSRIEVRSDGGQVIVHAWGVCHPRDCDWGEVTAHVFTTNVSGTLNATANSAIAEFDTPGINSMLVLHRTNGMLDYSLFTIFNNRGSTRSDYAVFGELVRP